MAKVIPSGEGTDLNQNAQRCLWK